MLQHHGSTVDKYIGQLMLTGFMHRDVSPSNVLVDMDTGLIKLADFGLAHRYSAELATWTADSSKLLSHQVGTRW